MENDIFAAALSATDQGHMIINAASSHMFLAPFMPTGIIDHSTHEQIMAGSPVSPTAQEEFLNNLYYTANNCGIPNGGTLVSRSILHNGSGYADGYSGDNHIGTSLSGASLTNLLSSNVGPGEGLFSIDNFSTSALSLDIRPLDSCNSFNSSYPIPRNHDYRAQDGPVQDEFLKAISTVHPSYYVMGNLFPGWNSNDSTLKLDHSDIYSLPRNELSLSLGSCQPSVLCMPDIPDHCSEMSTSIVTQVTPNSSEELSLYFGPPTYVHFSHVLLGSRYLDVAQEVLAEVVGYALGNSEELDDSVSGIKCEVRMPFSSSCTRTKGLSDVGSDELTSSGEIRSWEDVEHPMLEENKAEKNNLVTMLRMVDQRYNQCLDHIQNVITTFHDATNSSSPQVLARFALHTVSSTFKSLEQRITSQILLASQESNRGYTRGKEKDFEFSFIQKQWALQLGRKDQHSWRPQRGLPERSVSVLRAWMFQNFLQPYPKDNDKHMLALQSGLTRSQVSNWFINARVRLWKPMIEEMYSEIRKCQTEEVEGDFGSHGNIDNQRLRTN